MCRRLIVFGIGLVPLAGLAQVPPGHAYDPLIHPNPIVTFVTKLDFAPAGYEDARTAAGVELLGLSGSEGARDGIALAPGRTLEVRVLGRRTEALAFPVVRQRFTLTGGGALVLYSFRAPRTDLPSAEAEAMLNAEAFGPPRNPGRGRFGASPMPEMLSLRGRPALLFDGAGERSLFWEEEGASHVAVSDLDLDALFLVLEDLL